MTSSPPSTPHSTSKSPIENGTSSQRPNSNASHRYGKMRSPSPTLVPLHLHSSAQRRRGTPDSSRRRPPHPVVNPSTDGTPTKPAFSLLDRPKEVLRKKKMKKKETTRSLYCGSVTAQRVYYESTGCVGRLGGAGSSGTMRLHDAVAYQEKDGNEHGVWYSSERVTHEVFFVFSFFFVHLFFFNRGAGGTAMITMITITIILSCINRIRWMRIKETSFTTLLLV